MESFYEQTAKCTSWWRVTTANGHSHFRCILLFFGVKVHRVNAPPGALTMYTDQKINMYVLCTVHGFLG